MFFRPPSHACVTEDNFYLNQYIFLHKPPNKSLSLFFSFFCGWTTVIVCVIALGAATMQVSHTHILCLNKYCVDTERELKMLLLLC